MVLSTLTKRQIRNGLAEAIKYGIICDEVLFDDIRKNVLGLLGGDAQKFKDVVFQCSQIKARIVMNDEKETKGVRTILNFGHTVGHAIEAANQYRDYHHGEAVALGMRVAAELSCRLGLLARTEVIRIHQLLTATGLPEKIRKVNLGQIMNSMAYDKKFAGKKNRFVLATSIGCVKVVEGVSESVIKQAIKANM